MAGVIIVGSNIRRRTPRPITGESACTPSWDCAGLVLDKGENPHPFRLFLMSFCRIEASPEERLRGCVSCTHGSNSLAEN